MPCFFPTNLQAFMDLWESWIILYIKYSSDNCLFVNDQLCIIWYGCECLSVRLCELTSYLGHSVWSRRCGGQRRWHWPHGRSTHISQNPSVSPGAARSTESGLSSSLRSAAQIHPQYSPQEPAWHPLDRHKYILVCKFEWIPEMLRINLARL